MSDIFADTAGWGAWMHRREPHHAQATSLVRQIQQTGQYLVTTNYVLTELTALLTSPFRISKARQIQCLDALLTSTWVRVIHIDATLDAAAWALWRSRPDKEWSLVDCASFVVMQRLKLKAALTSDRHFEQPGFDRLLQ